jgi:hypothetical protein
MIEFEDYVIDRDDDLGNNEDESENNSVQGAQND